jgi:hypothetical protein
LFDAIKRTLRSLLPGSRDRGGIRFVSPPEATDADLAALATRLLDEPASLRATEWLRRSMTGFATPVSTRLPGHFDAYARIYHPFVGRACMSLEDTARDSWASLVGDDMYDAHVAVDVVYNGRPGVYAPTGCLPRVLTNCLATSLTSATTTPDDCFFAVWVGYGDGLVPRRYAPTLYLPGREYHVFAGSLSAADTSYCQSGIPYSYQSPNLWWPADHAWCVATEIDDAWTYVGGGRDTIDAILRDERFEAVETTADSDW